MRCAIIKGFGLYSINFGGSFDGGDSLTWRCRVGRSSVKVTLQVIESQSGFCATFIWLV